MQCPRGICTGLQNERCWFDCHSWNLLWRFFFDISPVIKLLSWSRTKLEHISRTFETNKTFVDIETEARGNTSSRSL